MLVSSPGRTAQHWYRIVRTPYKPECFLFAAAKSAAVNAMIFFHLITKPLVYFILIGSIFQGWLIISLIDAPFCIGIVSTSNVHMSSSSEKVHDGHPDDNGLKDTWYSSSFFNTSQGS